MRFIIGLIIGLASGLAAALLLAPERDLRRPDEEDLEEGESSVDWAGVDHDALARLRRATQGLREQVQVAWQEARQAAEEAEEEMRARYQQGASKGRR